MDIKETFKQRPISSIVGILTILSMLSGAAWGVEQRYNQTVLVNDIQQRMLQQQIDNYDDAIFKYEFLINQGKATALDKALKERLKQKRKDKKKELEDMKRR